MIALLLALTFQAPAATSAEPTETQRVMSELNAVDQSLSNLDQELDVSLTQSCDEVLNRRVSRLEVLMERAESRTEEGISVLQSEKRLKRMRAKVKMIRVSNLIKRMERKSKRVTQISDRCRYDVSLTAGERLDLASRLMHLSLRQTFLKRRLDVLKRDYKN